MRVVLATTAVWVLLGAGLVDAQTGKIVVTSPQRCVRLSLVALCLPIAATTRTRTLCRADRWCGRKDSLLRLLCSPWVSAATVKARLTAGSVTACWEINYADTGAILADNNSGSVPQPIFLAEGWRL